MDDIECSICGYVFLILHHCSTSCPKCLSFYLYDSKLDKYIFIGTDHPKNVEPAKV